MYDVCLWGARCVSCVCREGTFGVVYVSVWGHGMCRVCVCVGAWYVSCVCLCGGISMLVRSPMEVRRGLLTRTGVTSGCI